MKIPAIPLRDTVPKCPDEISKEILDAAQALAHGELPDAISAAGCIGKCFDFSQLSNEPSTEAVITDVIQFANARGFSLERIKKTV